MNSGSAKVGILGVFLTSRAQALLEHQALEPLFLSIFFLLKKSITAASAHRLGFLWYIIICNFSGKNFTFSPSFARNSGGLHGRRAGWYYRRCNAPQNTPLNPPRIGGLTRDAKKLMVIFLWYVSSKLQRRKYVMQTHSSFRKPWRKTSTFDVFPTFS